MVDDAAAGQNQDSDNRSNFSGRRTHLFISGFLVFALVPALNFKIPAANGNLLLAALAGGALAIGAWAWLFNATWLRLSVLYIFVFVVSQTYISPLVLEDRIITRDFRVLTPNFKRTSIIDSPFIEGISGQQTLVTDAEGFRTTRSINYAEKPLGTVRIFTVGGSTAEELHLGNDNGWAAGLERILTQHLKRPVEVINTGVSGLRAAHHAAIPNAFHPTTMLCCSVSMIGIIISNWAMARA